MSVSAFNYEATKWIEKGYPKNNEKLSLVLIIILSLHSWTKADDIKDFEWRMSLYDSALDHYTEKQIKKYTANYKYNNNDYIPVGTSKNVKVYDSIQFIKAMIKTIGW